eukprot:PITA_25027
MCRSPCCTKEGLNRGPWSGEEDMILLEYIRIHGDGGWKKVPQKAGRLPGRTDKEIKNYWNTRLKKKLLMEKSQPETISISSSAVQNHEVYKTNPVGITTAVKHIEMVTADGCGNKSQILPDVTDKATNSTCSMSRLVAQQSPHSEKFASHGTPVADNLFDLNNPSSSECNLLSSPPLWTDFGLEEFYMGLATPLAAEGIEFEDVCYDQNVNSFTFADDRGIEEFDTNSHQLDWIGFCEIDYIWIYCL